MMSTDRHRGSWAQRSSWILRLGSVLREHATELERAIALDTDKLRPDAAAEVRTVIDACMFYGLNAQHWSPGSSWASQPAGVVIAETPFGNPLWRLARLALPVLVGGSTLVVTCSERSARTVELMARAVQSAGFANGTVTVRSKEPRPLTDVRTRRATYNYGAHPADTPERLWGPMVLATSEGVLGLARRAVRRAASPGLPVTPTAVRLVTTPSMHDEVCCAVAQAARDAPTVMWRSSPEVSGHVAAGSHRGVPLVLVEVARDIDSALDYAQGTVFGLHALLGEGDSAGKVRAVGNEPWQISEVWSTRADLVTDAIRSWHPDPCASVTYPIQSPSYEHVVR